ncbi:MAG: hypothetical protein MJ104_03455 [Lachnospiraceae bacterium]|nr:hypothetical protein [Lachnospiraceae bacterium]
MGISLDFEIRVSQNYLGVESAVKDFFQEEHWVITKEDEDNKNKKGNFWMYQKKESHVAFANNVVFDPEKEIIKGDLNGVNIENKDVSVGEVVEEIYKHLIYYIADYITEKVTDSEFEGECSYDEGFISMRTEFSYINGKLESNSYGDEGDDY